MNVRNLFSDRCAHVFAYVIVSNYVFSRTVMNQVLDAHSSGNGRSNKFTAHSNYMYDSYREYTHNFIAERLCNSGRCVYYGKSNWCDTCVWSNYIKRCIEYANIPWKGY